MIDRTGQIAGALWGSGTVCLRAAHEVGAGSRQRRLCTPYALAPLPTAAVFCFEFSGGSRQSEMRMVAQCACASSRLCFITIEAACTICGGGNSLLQNHNDRRVE
jgi:hypothetical protein